MRVEARPSLSIQILYQGGFHPQTFGNQRVVHGPHGQERGHV